ncbi:MAG: CBS domain-containing protein [Candidatus Bathyarchaeota archaeon]|nr:CBS domain-containing protein [Candidatus Bathyarchaeota archaeon]
MSLEITAKMQVREAMSSPVIAVHENADVVDVAKLMSLQRVGAIIINNNEDKPIGIVTERDIVTRVVAEGKNPDKLSVKDVMTSPLRTVEPEMNLMEAMTLMDKLNIRRLGVTYKGGLVGVVSDRNIIRLVPTIVEIVKERREINNTGGVGGPSIVGYCEQCEVYSNNLRVIDGEFLCEDCRLEA